jgi:hypothetical protein
MARKKVKINMARKSNLFIFLLAAGMLKGLHFLFTSSLKVPNFVGWSKGGVFEGKKRKEISCIVFLLSARFIILQKL